MYEDIIENIKILQKEFDYKTRQDIKDIEQYYKEKIMDTNYTLNSTSTGIIAANCCVPTPSCATFANSLDTCCTTASSYPSWYAYDKNTIVIGTDLKVEGNIIIRGDLTVRGEIKLTNNKPAPEFGGAFYDKTGKLIYIERIIYSNPAIIAFWSDGEKTVAKALHGDTFDMEKGLMVIMLKRLMGSDGLNKLISDWAIEDVKERKLADVRRDRRKK